MSIVLDSDFWTVGAGPLWFLAFAIIFSTLFTSWMAVKNTNRVSSDFKRIADQLGKITGELGKDTGELKEATTQLNKELAMLREVSAKLNDSMHSWLGTMKNMFPWIPQPHDGKVSGR